MRNVTAWHVEHNESDGFPGLDQHIAQRPLERVLGEVRRWNGMLQQICEKARNTSSPSNSSA